MRNARGSRTHAARRPPKPLRVFGALRNVVRVDPSFFDPLPIAELDAWEPKSKKKRTATPQERLAVALEAFWLVSEDWSLSCGEQCAVLAISRSTLARWKAKAPTSRKVAYRTIDRLLLTLRTYVWLSEVVARARGWDDMRRWYVRVPGGAKNPEDRGQSILETLTDRSVLAVLDHYCRFVQSLPVSSRQLRLRRRAKSSGVRE
jgi:hypothetical protein